MAAPCKGKPRTKPARLWAAIAPCASPSIAENGVRRGPHQFQAGRRQTAFRVHQCFGKRRASVARPLAIATRSAALAQRGGAAVGWHHPSARRSRRNFGTPSACGNQFALERRFPGGHLPAFQRTGLRRARRLRARCHGEKRNLQGRRSGGLDVFRPGPRGPDSSLGLDRTR